MMKMKVMALMLLITFLYVYYHYTSSNVNTTSEHKNENSSVTELVFNDKKAWNVSLTILAFGDSLTRGLYRSQKLHGQHPYTLKLEELLAKHFQGNYIRIINAGLNAELVQVMKKRLQAILDKNRIDYVIILGGTNDYAALVLAGKRLFFNDTQEKYMVKNHGEVNKYITRNITKETNIIYDNIIELHELCHERRIKTALMTIPGTSWEHQERISEYLVYHENINTKLREFSRRDNDTTLIDLASRFPSLLNEDEKLTWSDGVHFTPVGYDKMGEFIYYDVTNDLAQILLSKEQF